MRFNDNKFNDVHVMAGWLITEHNLCLLQKSSRSQPCISTGFKMSFKPEEQLMSLSALVHLVVMPSLKRHVWQEHLTSDCLNYYSYTDSLTFVAT